MTTRCFSSEEKNRARNYLDAWVGSSSQAQTIPSKKMRSTTHNTVIKAPLLLSGSSYLIPTLRIERSDTPESISTRIEAALEDSYPPSTGIVKSMLRGKATARGARWQAPIILDLAALVPDGSPHYAKPQRGLLSGLVKILEKYGIRVVGVTNTPSTLEEEAVQKLGLPAFMSKGRVLDRQSATSKVCLEDVIEMLLTKSQQDIKEEDEMLNASVTSEPSDENKFSQEAPQVNADDPIDKTHTTRTETVTGTDNMEKEGGNTDDAKEDSEPSVPIPEGGTYVYHGSVRSGQQVAAQQNQSLIIIGSVNSGGEVMSDRDIFVFGKLRGRALAGLASSEGDETTSARIFATSFDAELICIGDTFTTVDSVTELGLDRPGEAAMVTLNSSRELVFERVPL